jgi:outer membrane protein OmpA-like peptidoglycan-associated protein
VLFPRILNLGPGESIVNQSGLRFPAVLAFLFAFAATALPQFPNPSALSPKLAIYGGYSGYKPGGKSSGIDLGRTRGWNSGAEVQFTPRYSFFADYGHYENSVAGTTQTYLFGPRFTFHAKALSPFAQVMMGFERIGAKNQPTYTAFSEAFGGGLDIAIARRFSLRLFQADLIYAADHEKTKLELNQFYGARVSAGIVWNISRKQRPSVVAKEKPTTETKVEEKKSEIAETKKPESPAQPSPSPAPETSSPAQPVTTPADSEPAKPEASAAETKQAAAEEKKPETPASAVKDSEVKNVGNLNFPYEQYPTYLSPQDKRTLDAVASRLKLEPESTLSIVGASPRWAGPKAAAQRAVNSKDYLVKKGIAADRVKVFARPTVPAKSKPARTELMFVPAGQTFTVGSATPVDEHRVKPERLHVEHPEWREK